jgi:hypothetical protein
MQMPPCLAQKNRLNVRKEKNIVTRIAIVLHECLSFLAMRTPDEYPRVNLFGYLSRQALLKRIFFRLPLVHGVLQTWCAAVDSP